MEEEQGMKKTLKKVTTSMIAAGLLTSASFTGSFVYADQSAAQIQKVQIQSVQAQTTKAQTAQARYKEPEEWNQTEIKAYQFDSTNQYEKYLLTGGNHLYNKNFKAEDRMIKITVADLGYFAIATESEDQEEIRLYDESKQKVLAKTTSDGDLEYGKLAKAGEVFYVKLPQKIDKVMVMAGVIKDGFGSMKASDTYYESGTGEVTYHPFTISKRSAVEFDISSIERKGGMTYAHIEKKEKGQWKRLDSTVKINPASYDDDFVHGLTKGEYRLAIKAPVNQLNAVSYTRSTKNKKFSYKKAKAKKIGLNKENANIYTTGEKAPRWYKVNVTSTKKKRMLNLGKDTVSGGYKFTIYQKGKKKALKTIKVTGNANAKTTKLPKKKGTYYIKISKLTKKTNGTYEIGFY